MLHFVKQEPTTTMTTTTTTTNLYRKTTTQGAGDLGLSQFAKIFHSGPNCAAPPGARHRNKPIRSQGISGTNVLVRD